jgi:hypothetical protein
MREKAKDVGIKANHMVVSILRRLLQQVLPLVLALYTNFRYLRSEVPEAEDALPKGDWVNEEAGDLLARSEGRLETVESKGPGLATVCAIVAAAIGVAISLTWDESTMLGKVLLVVAGAYSVMSLYAPVALVGPVRRETITRATVEDAAKQPDPPGYLAGRKARGSAVNDQTTLRLSNLQAAARNDVLKAILMFTVWGIVALTGHADVLTTPH